MPGAGRQLSFTSASPPPPPPPLPPPPLPWPPLPAPSSILSPATERLPTQLLLPSRSPPPTSDEHHERRLFFFNGHMHSPPPPPGQCSNTCGYANDFDCDDGGPGAEFTACSLGTDCSNCGPRESHSHTPHSHSPHSHSPHSHSPHGHSPHGHSPHGHSPHSHTPHSHSPGTMASLLAVSTVNGITYYSGSGSSWTVPQYSPLVSYACDYNLCTITAPFDGTASNPLGNSIDFAGPNYQPLPYTYTIEMGARYTFSHWRVAGQTWYRFGQVHLKYADTSGTLVTVPGSNTDFTTIPEGEFAYGTFSSPVTASRWQVVITTYANTDSQAMFQCYLREVQFGAAGACLLYTSPSPRDS